MKENLGRIIAVILLVSASFLGSTFSEKILGTGSASIQEQLKEAEDEINKTCPQKLDNDTRLDKVKSGPGKKFTYYYTLINIDSDKLPKEAFDEQIGPEIKKNAIDGEGVQTMLKKGITVEYHYAGKDGKKISHISIDPSNAKKL